MSTMYVVIDKECPECGAKQMSIIGISSAGHCFSLSVYPSRGLNSLDDWKEYLKDKTILTEYGDEVRLDTLVQTITKRSWSKVQLASSLEEQGPNCLLRLRVDGKYCIGHGDTWDLIDGEAQ